MGVWNKSNGVGCSHGYHYNNLTIKCHGHSYAGNIQSGIKHSCNAYFCTLFRAIVDKHGFKNSKIGLDSLNEYLYRFGMGKPLGIDYPGEKDGFTPTSKYYDKMITKKGRGPWYSTTIVSLGIGQGENLLTTVQMANMAAAIANRGFYYTPHLVKGLKSGEKLEAADLRFLKKHDTGVEARHFEDVIEGMQMVVEEGTGSNARVSGITVCGKTGTSQNPHGADNSVFIGFAPKNDPKIVIAVYVENSGFGNDFAAPITSLMIEQYLRGSIPQYRKWLVEKMQHAKLIHSPGRGFYIRKGG
jgi:penicillin-binding protein 2